MTLHNFILSIDLYVQKRYKKPLQTIKDGPVSQTSFSNWFLGNLAPLMSNSLCLPPPPSPFQAEFPSGAWRLSESTYLPWLLRPTREGAQGRAPSAIQVGAGGLMQMVQVPCLITLLVFHINQVIQPLFSTNFPTIQFLLNLFLYF